MCFQRSSERIEGKSRLPQSGWKIVPQSRTGCRETPVAKFVVCSWHEQLPDVVGMGPQQTTTSVRQKMTVDTIRLVDSFTVVKRRLKCVKEEENVCDNMFSTFYASSCSVLVPRICCSAACGKAAATRLGYADENRAQSVTCLAGKQRNE